MRSLGAGALFVLISAVISPVLAASQRDKDDCNASDPDRSVHGCTRIIQDRGEATENHVNAYNNRGIAYRAKGDHARAIADFSEAIRLNPNAFTYYNRGVVYGSKGDHDRAIADYNEAIRLDPNNARASYRHCVAYISKGDDK